MIKIVLFSLLILAGNISIAQLPNCYPFKEGKFQINDKRAGGIIMAERRGGYQTESMEVIKAVVRFKIVWLNDCSYKLTLDKIIRNENQVPFPGDMTVTVKIISSKDNNSYMQQATSSVMDGSYVSEVTRIR